MTLPPVVILRVPLSKPESLPAFVEQCLLDRVELIAVAGTGCVAMEFEIDWLVVGDGTETDRYVTTSSHPNESFAEVMEFASSWIVKRSGGVRIVSL